MPIGAARYLDRQGRRTAAADRPADPDGARGRERVRQDRTRRDGDRSGAAGDGRNDDPVQAARIEWRAGMTPEKLIEELDRVVKVPGLANVWIPPIRNRIDMLATGIKSPVGIKVAGERLEEIDRVAATVERDRQDRAGRHLGARRAAHRRPLHRRRPGSHGGRRATVSSVADVQSVVASAIGGENIGETIEGPAALPDQRALPARVCATRWSDLRELPIVTARGAQIRARRCRDASRSATGRRCSRARTRGCRAGSTSTSAVATCARWCRDAGARRARGEAAAGLLDRVVGPVRVSRACNAAA